MQILQNVSILKYLGLLMFVPSFVISDGNETLSVSDAPGTQE